MEDLCVLHADLESDHAGFVGGVCDHGRGGVAAVYERLYADDDVCGYAVYSGAFWRRVPKALVPFGGGFRRLMLSGNGLYHHTLCPVLSVISYVLWEGHSAVWQVPVAITFVYGIVMMYMNYREYFDGPYPFFRVNHQSRAATVLWIAALTGMITVIALVMRWAA